MTFGEKPNKETRLEDGLPTEGVGPFKYQWYSICSTHYKFDAECQRCMSGHWINCWKHGIGHFIYENDPVLWRWWANRPRLLLSSYRLGKQIISSIKNKNAK